MKKKRLWTTATASLAILAAGVTTAYPANAATLTIDCTTAPPTVQVPAGDTVEITGCTWVAWSMAPSTATNVTVSAGGQTISKGGLTFYYGAASSTLAVSGIESNQIASFELYNSSSTSPSGTRYTISLAGSSGGNSDSVSSATASAPVEASLSLDLAASGASCTSGSAATGLVGTWLTLPGAGDCSSTTTPDAKLLGWATKADFPVEIAQRQIDNGWGAYELFNDEGRMTAVFIPAGGATFISAGNTLHPIWAN